MNYLELSDEHAMRLDALIANLLDDTRQYPEDWKSNHPGHPVPEFAIANLEAVEALSKQLRTIRKQIVANK